MALIDDIIEMASNNKEPIGNLLRKCLILERQIPNEKFRAWLDNELDGYNSQDDLPSYRVFSCVNKGLFIGLAVQLNDQPLALHVMEEKDRKLIEKLYLGQPAAAFDGADRAKDSILPWNPHLTAKYQTKFFKDQDLVLNRAWQEIPGSVTVALLEQVRTRVLRFALDIKENLPSDAITATSVPASVVERSVVNNIFHGDVLIASNIEYTHQITNQNVAVGDFASLTNALKQIGITDDGIKALSEIQAEKPAPSGLGEKAKSWLADIGKYVGKEGAKAGVEVAKRAAMKWLMQYYGLDT